MKIVEIECRKLDEWSDDIQKAIIEKHSTFNVDGDSWWEGEVEYWTDELAKMGYDIREQKWKDEKKYDKESGKWKFTGSKVSYTEILIAFSGFWSQGDGASFTGTIDVSKWIEYMHLDKYSRIKKLIDSGAIPGQGVIKRDRWHNYSHWNTTSIYYDWYTEDRQTNVQALLDELENDILEHHQQLNKDIYKALETEYENETSEDAVRESLTANEYEFDETGKIM